MKYYYEYKEKNGCKAGGHNLETIDFFDNYIRLLGVDILQTNYGYNMVIKNNIGEHFWI